MQAHQSSGPSGEQPALVVEELRKRYGGVEALRGVNFELRRGEIHALCGENGAGKSTLVKILGGLVEPSSGRITVAGAPLRTGRRTDPRLISIVHQELSIIPDLSVLDNILIGDDGLGEILRRSRYAADVRARLDQIGLSHVALDTPAKALTLGERQLVEIARGVARGARILLLDEPTATLSDAEIQRVFAAVRWLRDQGSTIVFISHRLPEVFELTDRVTVFRNGAHVLTADTASLTRAALVKAMIGHEVAARDHRSAVAPTDARERIALSRVALPGRLSPVDLSFRRGEIAAIVGQLGSGADLLVEAVAGGRSYDGQILVDGEPVRCRSARDAIGCGIAYVPEDRAGKGVFLDAPVETNITASILAQLSRMGFLRHRMAAKSVRDLAGQFTIDPRRLPADVCQLSGGNQQKVAIAKAAALDPRVLVLNEPTRGVDIGARTEIYGQLRAIAATGVTVLFFTTDIEEVLEFADRVVTVFRGRIVSDRPIAGLGMDDILTDIVHGPADVAVEVAA